MPFRVRSNIKQVQKQLTAMERKQIPFAASSALNTVAFSTRKRIVDVVWPNSFPRSRNRRFPAVLFRVGKASKRKLLASVYQSLDRDYIPVHISGGGRTAARSSTRAVPINAQRTASGRMKAAQRPRALRNSFVADVKGRGPAIYQKQGGRLRLMYVLKRMVSIRRAFPFYRAGYAWAEQQWPRAFDEAVRRALRTAR